MHKWGLVKGEAEEVSRNQTVKVSRLRDGIATLHKGKDFSKT